METLHRYGIVPVDVSVLQEDLVAYSSPKDKISRLEKEHEIIRLRKGLYVVAQDTSEQTYSTELIANHLYGPSYVSYETALSFHGLIPERVYVTKSACVKRKREYVNTFGTFEYITVPRDYYPIALQQIVVENKYAFIMATPEKAICDLIMATSGLRIQSVKAMMQYLIEDLRIDFEENTNWIPQRILECAQHGYKKRELTLFHTALLQILNTLNNG